MGRVIDLFRAWDINENGEISKAEFRKGVIATLGITPSREAAALFAFLDPDGSGTIDYRGSTRSSTAAVHPAHQPREAPVEAPVPPPLLEPPRAAPLLFTPAGGRQDRGGDHAALR